MDIHFNITDAFGDTRKWVDELDFIPPRGMIFIKHYVECLEVTEVGGTRYEYGVTWNKFEITELFYDNGRIVVHGFGS